VASPADLATIGFEVLDDPVLAEIVATPETTVEGSNGPQFLENRNLLLESYKGALGIKTGMTSLAGNVLVAAAERRDDVVVVVAMRSIDAAADARALLDYAFARLRSEISMPAGKEVTEIVVDPGGTIEVVTSQRVEVLPPPGGVEKRVRLARAWSASLRQGERVGTLELVADGRVVASTPLESADPVDEPAESLLGSVVEALLSAVYAAGKAIGVA
jgi:D-alanyl-D-alanine carboxypeptidase (penicillin-binding protein 5/6)